MRKLIVVIGLAMSACTIPSSDIKPQLRYFQDERTGVCFAYNQLTGSSSLTAVQCTPAILDIIRFDVSRENGGAENIKTEGG